MSVEASPGTTLINERTASIEEGGYDSANRPPLTTTEGFWNIFRRAGDNNTELLLLVSFGDVSRVRGVFDEEVPAVLSGEVSDDVYTEETTPATAL